MKLLELGCLCKAIICCRFTSLEAANIVTNHIISATKKPVFSYFEGLLSKTRPGNEVTRAWLSVQGCDML